MTFFKVLYRLDAVKFANAKTKSVS